MRRWIRHMRGMAQGIGRRKTRLLRRLQLAANGRFVLDARDLAERLINRPLVSLSLFFSLLHPRFFDVDNLSAC